MAALQEKLKKAELKLSATNLKHAAEVKKLNEKLHGEKKRYNEALRVRRQESERALRAYMKSAIYFLQRLRKT
jgi:molybdopterin converting factor small subunit